MTALNLVAGVGVDPKPRRAGDLHTASSRQWLGDRITVTDAGCWLWRHAVNSKGYATTKVDGRTWYVHRYTFTLDRGPIPAGLTLDHLCRVRRCVRPDHLEPVTNRENTLRSPLTLATLNLAKTHCPQGHPYSPENTYILRNARHCRECGRARSSARYAARATNTGLRESSPSRALPKAGSLPWLRCFYGGQFRRGALVTVNGARGWISSAAAGSVHVQLDDGGRAVVRPGEITSPN